MKRKGCAGTVLRTNELGSCCTQIILFQVKEPMEVVTRAIRKAAPTTAPQERTVASCEYVGVVLEPVRRALPSPADVR